MKIPTFIRLIVVAIPAVLLGLRADADEVPGIAAPLHTKARIDSRYPLRPAGDREPVLNSLIHPVVCKVHFTVNADGTLGEFSIAVSAGRQDIDELCLRAFIGERMLPATDGGLPISSTVDMPITWFPAPHRRPDFLHGWPGQHPPP